MSPRRKALAAILRRINWRKNEALFSETEGETSMQAPELNGESN